MSNTVAAVTMVKEDPFFLRTWVKYYGDLLGRENLYVINHGRGETVAREAQGCNVIGIPEGNPKHFDQARWKLLNGLLNGLNAYYSHVIIGDVDELVVVDPKLGVNLKDWLQDDPRGRVTTPLGLEVLHHPDLEPEGVADRILGPRRFVRTLLRYSKPCVISKDVKLSRGGHFSSSPQLDAPDHLYLFHLKYCDFGVYVDTTNARNSVAKSADASVKEAFIGRHWFAEFRGEDKAVFEEFSAIPLEPGFDMEPYRNTMRATYAPRGDSGFFKFDLTEKIVKYELPERFFGVF